MNRKQLIALWLGVAALVETLIYPPFLVSHQPFADVDVGRHAQLVRSLVVIEREWHWWLWRVSPTRIASAEIDGVILGMEAAMIALIAGALIVSFRDRRSS